MCKNCNLSFEVVNDQPLSDLDTHLSEIDAASVSFNTWYQALAEIVGKYISPLIASISLKRKKRYEVYEDYPYWGIERRREVRLFLPISIAIAKTKAVVHHYKLPITEKITPINKEA